MFTFLFSVALIPLVFAASIPCARHEHSEVLPKRLSASWHQPRDHFAHALFSRGPGGGFPEVGSSEWSAGFPPAGPSAAVGRIPADWKAALDEAVSAGKIPDIPRTTVGNNGPSYPRGVNAADPKVCSSTVQCRLAGDLWDAPDGVFASSFDDGPLPPTPKLLEFLEQRNVTTTHFLIGYNILTNVDEWKQLIDSEGDLAVHTWSHRYTTSLSNEEVVGELGWTMQLIYNSTGGKLPRFWRPPYGDSDARVSAIAKEVFGMTTVIWNRDSQDWTMASSGGPSEDKVVSDVKRYISSDPKSPGIMLLEHDLSDRTVDVFVKIFPDIAANGWKFMSLADAYGDDEYQVQPDIISLFGTALPTTSTSASSTNTSATGGASQTAQSNSQSNSAFRSKASYATTLTIMCLTYAIMTINYA